MSKDDEAAEDLRKVVAATTNRVGSDELDWGREGPKELLLLLRTWWLMGL